MGLSWTIICLGLWLGSPLIRQEYRGVIVDYLFYGYLEMHKLMIMIMRLIGIFIGEQMRM